MTFFFPAFLLLASPFAEGSTSLRPSAVAQEGKGAAASVETLVKDLGASSSTQRYHAYRKLIADRPEKALPLLVELLPSFALDGRRYGLYVLGAFPLERARPFWKRLLRCRDPYLRFAAELRLETAGERGMRERILTSIREAPDDPGLRVAMLQRVYRPRDPEVRGALLAWFRPGIAGDELQALLTTFRTDPGEDLPQTLRGLLSSVEPRSERAWLLRTFLRTRGVEVAPERIPEDYRDVGSHLLGRGLLFLESASSLDPRILEALTARLKRDRPDSLAARILTLLASRGHKPAIPIVRRFMKSKTSYLAKAAFEAAEKFGILGDGAIWKKRLSDPDPFKVLDAAEALRKRDFAEAVPALLRLLEQPGPHRVRTLRALGETRSPRSVEALLDALDDQDAAVRAQAAFSLTLVLHSLFPYRRFDLSSTGYAASGPDASRRRGLAKIRRWWARHGKRGH